jgi:phospholipid transport system substrate-binding protein
MEPRRFRKTTLFAATALVLACSPAHAGAPTDRLREFFAKVNAILADPSTEDRPLERVVRVRRLVNDIADVQSAAARALGAEWDRRTAAERDEFVAIFTELLERAYVGRLAGAVGASGAVVMTYGDEVRSGDEATVTTSLRGAAQDLRVEYVMTGRGGRWRVRDIVIDGVSTVENYRAQFSRVLHHDAYAGLVRQLRAKLGGEGRMFARWVRPAPSAPIEFEVPFGVAPREAASPPVALAPKPRPPAPAPARVVSPPPPARVASAPPPPEPSASPPPVVEPVVRPAPRPKAARPAARPAPPPAAEPVVMTAAALETQPGVVQSLLGALVIGLVGAAAAALLRRRTGAASKPVPFQVLWGPHAHDRPRDLRGLAGAEPERRVSRNGASHARVGAPDRRLEP